MTNKPSEQTIVINMSMTRDFADFVTRWAKFMSKTRSQFIRDALTEYIARLRQTPISTGEGTTYEDHT